MRKTSAAAAAVGFASGGLLTVLLLMSYDSTWSWVANLTAKGWSSTLVPSLIALALTTVSSVWAWRVLSAEPRTRWLLPVALGTWWFSWWLVPGNLAVLGIDASQNIDWDSTTAPPDTIVWISASTIAAICWLATLTTWYGRRRDSEQVASAQTPK